VIAPWIEIDHTAPVLFRIEKGRAERFEAGGTAPMQFGTEKGELSALKSTTLRPCGSELEKAS